MKRLKNLFKKRPVASGGVSIIVEHRNGITFIKISEFVNGQIRDEIIKLDVNKVLGRQYQIVKNDY